MVHFERVFKQQIRDEKNKYQENRRVEFEEEEEDEDNTTQLPGMGSLASYTPAQLSRDLAARRIQSAFRHYISRQRQKPTYKKPTNQVSISISYSIFSNLPNRIESENILYINSIFLQHPSQSNFCGNTWKNI